MLVLPVNVKVFPPPVRVIFPPVTFRVLEVVPPAIVNPSALEVGVKPFIVLFVSASLPARVDRVPVVGSVTFVDPVVVRVSAFVPEVVNEDAVVKAPPRDVV